MRRRWRSRSRVKCGVPFAFTTATTTPPHGMGAGTGNTRISIGVFGCCATLCQRLRSPRECNGSCAALCQGPVSPRNRLPARGTSPWTSNEARRACPLDAPGNPDSSHRQGMPTGLPLAVDGGPQAPMRPAILSKPATGLQTKSGFEQSSLQSHSCPQKPRSPKSLPSLAP